MKANLYILVLLITIATASALDICSDKNEILTDCVMVTPPLNCTNYTYSIFNISGNLSMHNNLSEVYPDSDIYQFNFTQPEGNWVIQLCDGTSREVNVKESPNIKYQLYIITIIMAALLWYLGYKNELPFMVSLSGFIIASLGIYLWIDGFPYLTNDFLQNGLSLIMVGMGAFLAAVPIIEWTQELLK